MFANHSTTGQRLPIAWASSICPFAISVLFASCDSSSSTWVPAAQHSEEPELDANTSPPEVAGPDFSHQPGNLDATRSPDGNDRADGGHPNGQRDSTSTSNDVAVRDSTSGARPDSGGTGTCPPGTESCPCYPNNTCDVLDGTPMDCVSGTCRPHAALADPHGLGTPCAVDLDCGAHEGVPLVCTGGACAFPGCVAGEAGCACPPFGACAAGLDCEGGFCVAPDCRAGSEGCPCAAGVCDAPTQCVRGVCRVGEERLANLVAPAGGRACDARLTLPASGRVTITFDSAVRGADFRTAGVLGLSFVARQDAPLPGAPIQFDSADPATVAALQITDFTCYDRQGRALPGARLSLDR